MAGVVANTARRSLSLLWAGRTSVPCAHLAHPPWEAADPRRIPQRSAHGGRAPLTYDVGHVTIGGYTEEAAAALAPTGGEHMALR